MAAVQVLTGCNLRWWSFSSAIEHIYFLAHVVVHVIINILILYSQCKKHKLSEIYVLDDALSNYLIWFIIFFPLWGSHQLTTVY